MPAAPSPEEVAYMMAHASDTLVPNIIACCSVCGIAATVIVALRQISRRLVHRRWYADASDWLLLAAWVLFAVFVVTFAMTTMYGAGRHVILVTNVRMLQIFTIINGMFYIYSMAFIKFSILALYATIFQSSRRFRWCCWGVGGFVAAWAIATSLPNLFQCVPIRYGWDKTVEDGRCLQLGLVVLTTGAVNIFTDLVILAMPVPLVLRLNTSRKKKQGIIATFMIGGLACVVSVARLGYSIEVGTTTDGSWDNIPAGMISVAELMAGMLAASLPTYRPLYRKLRYGSADKHGSGNRGSSSGAYPGGKNGSAYYYYNNNGNRNSMPNSSNNPQRTGHGASISHSPSPSGTFGGGGYHHHHQGMTPPNNGGISVTDQVELVTHAHRGGQWVRVADDEVGSLYGAKGTTSSGNGGGSGSGSSVTAAASVVSGVSSSGTTTGKLSNDSYLMEDEDLGLHHSHTRTLAYGPQTVPIHQQPHAL